MPPLSPRENQPPLSKLEKERLKVLEGAVFSEQLHALLAVYCVVWCVSTHTFHISCVIVITAAEEGVARGTWHVAA